MISEGERIWLEVLHKVYIGQTTANGWHISDIKWSISRGFYIRTHIIRPDGQFGAYDNITIGHNLADVQPVIKQLIDGTYNYKDKWN